MCIGELLILHRQPFLLRGKPQTFENGVSQETSTVICSWIAGMEPLPVTVSMMTVQCCQFFYPYLIWPGSIAPDWGKITTAIRRYAMIKKFVTSISLKSKPLFGWCTPHLRCVLMNVTIHWFKVFCFVFNTP